jgi:murein DD-endopeptidase MepM/ murein hydrolase activator NlpD
VNSLLKVSWLLVALMSLGCATTRGRNDIVIVVVKRDDTLNSIAKKYDTDWRLIASMNRESLSNGLREGQELAVKVGPSAMISRNDDSGLADDQGDDDDMGFLPRRPKGLLQGPSSREPIDLIFPVEGGISSHFGKRGRRQHKGIDIIANVGTPIVAAGDGEVIFSGRQRGYGSTVVVDHGQFMTLYAHASKLIARTGDRVKQGDFIAKVGRSGNARGAHLHFELRDSRNKPIDPEPYLKHKTLARLNKAPTGKRVAAGSEVKPMKVILDRRNTTNNGRAKKGLLYAKD